MALSDLVNVTVVLQNPGISAPGFGTQLIPSYSATWAERTRTYTSIGAVGVDFATTTVEYLAANAAFSQTPAPTQVVIGRCALPPTNTWTIGIVTVTAGLIYKIRVNKAAALAPGGTPNVQYTATGAAAWVALTAYVKGQVVTNDTGKLYICKTNGTSAGSGGPTGTTLDITDGTVHWTYVGAGGVGAISNDAIVIGLQQIFDALSLATFTSSTTGSAGSLSLVLTAATAGNWIGIEVYDTKLGGVGGLMSLLEGGTDPGIATDLGNIADENQNWYGVNLTFKSSAQIQAAATWVESNGRLLIASSADTICATVADGSATDVCHAIKAAARARTAMSFHPRNDEFFDCATFGRWASISPGKDNWRMKTLSGVTPAALTGTQITNLGAKLANWYYALGAGSSSVNVVGGAGRTGANQPIDVTRFVDWYTINLQVDLVNLQLQNEKIPYTDAGIAKVEGVVRARNALGIEAGGITNNPAPVVTVPKASSVPAADRSTRTLNNVNTTWQLAGAINKINVNVQVIY